MAATKIEVLIQKKLRQKFQDFKKYLKRFLFPLYFFPIKLFTYSLYYGLKLALKIAIWPFRGWGNFFKAIAGIALLAYIFFSLLVIADYIKENYGHYSKFLCYGVKEQLSQSVVRIVGGYAEGSGFFIAPSQVLTNFHVIAGEPSPKVVFSSGGFVTPQRIIGDKDADLALLFLPEQYPDLALPFTDAAGLYEDEPLLAAGYALGTDLPGQITIQEGKFRAFRTTRDDPVSFIQADINLIPGMSGGPLVDKCGQVVGVNTMGLYGLFLFITAVSVEAQIPYFTDADIVKIEVDPSASPEEAVYAFYTYLKARRMEEGFALLSREYLQKTNFAEWTGRFADVLDVQIYETKLEDAGRNIVFVKFSTKNWVYEEVEEHFYEGTWETVFEDGVYKMLRSNIQEVFAPEWWWFLTQEKLEELGGTPLF